MARSAFAPPARRAVLTACAWLALLAAGPARQAAAQPLAPALAPGSPAALCDAAVRAAERRYGLPAGLLLAIGLAETGRPDPLTRRLAPWPWSVQAENQGLFFDSKDQAVRWVREAQGRGVTSIDTGCMQVNLAFHPDAFETLDAAFDPRRNADYAARFLLQLHAATGDWRLATGAYHSQTQAFAAPYIARVQSLLGTRPLGTLAARPPSTVSVLADAWRATTPAAAADGKPDALEAGRGWSVLLNGRARPDSHRPARPLAPPPLRRLAAADPPS